VSVKRWTLAAVVVTAVTGALFATIVAIGFVLPRTHVQITGVLATLPNLVLLLLGASVILWIVTGARWVARR
jgi:hypothetical protein